MGLNFSRILLVLSVVGVSSAFAQDVDYLTIGSVKISRIHQDVFNQEISETVYEKSMQRQEILDLPGMPNKSGQVSTANVGAVIAVAREIVALGEDIYALVQKGKPVNKTSYAPISVIPRAGDASVDIFELTGWKMPTVTTYEIVYENLFGMEVVKFRYKVIFSYGGKYKGKGAYLTAAQIVPESVSTLFGYSFSATMKLNGIQNYGTKESPIAGAILAMEYTVETVMKASLETDSYSITGEGKFKAL